MFECVHCHTQYSKEKGYLNHLTKCKILLRKNHLKTITGRNAFSYYKKWLNNKGCYNTVAETFITSHYYTSFVNFSNFSIEKQIPDIDLYIKNCVKVPPNLWTNSQIYSSYIKYLDNLEPMRNVTISIVTLRKLAKMLDCEVEEVLHQLHIENIIKLLHSRHFSPWFLLNSTKIKEVITDPNITPFQHETLEMYINPNIWTNKFNKNKESVDKIKKYLKLNNL